MTRILQFCAVMLVSVAALAEDPVVFRSDVSLVRVDVQVLDGSNRAVTLLTAKDFTLRDQGRTQEIRNFASENMPVDVLLLLDVSASMRSHVQKMANASQRAMRVLRPDDRVAMMVFDRSTRTKMPFHNSREELDKQFRDLLKHESFNGGTDITRGLLDAANYVQRNARKDARRAIVILTDDETEAQFEVDEQRVGRALVRADAVLSALIAPNAMNYANMPQRGGYPGGQRGGRQGQGGRRGGGLGGIIIGMPGGGGYPGGGQRQPQGGPQQRGGQQGPRTLSAHTSEIAIDSGGDSSSVDDASAFEDMIERIRQRYALYFLSPSDARPGEERTLSVSLAGAARQRYPNSELRFRKTYYAPESSGAVRTESIDSSEPSASTGRARTNSRAEAAEDDSSRPTIRRSNSKTDSADSADDSRPAVRRRPVSDGSGSSRGPNPALRGGDNPPQETAPQPSPAPAPAPETKTGGWRKVEDPSPAPKP